MARKIEGKIDSNAAMVKSKVEALNKIFSSIADVTRQINDLGKMLKNLEVNDKDIMKAKDDIIKEVKKVNALVNEEAKKQSANRINAIAAFGHKRA